MIAGVALNLVRDPVITAPMQAKILERKKYPGIANASRNCE